MVDVTTLKTLELVPEGRDEVPDRVSTPLLGVNVELGLAGVTVVVETKTALLEILLMLVPIGMSEVDTTVKLAGQLSTPEEQDVTVVMSVLYIVTVTGPEGGGT